MCSSDEVFVQLNVKKKVLSDVCCMNFVCTHIWHLGRGTIAGMNAVALRFSHAPHYHSKCCVSLGSCRATVPQMLDNGLHPPGSPHKTGPAPYTMCDTAYFPPPPLRSCGLVRSHHPDRRPRTTRPGRAAPQFFFPHWRHACFLGALLCWVWWWSRFI